MVALKSEASEMRCATKIGRSEGCVLSGWRGRVGAWHVIEGE